MSEDRLVSETQVTFTISLYILVNKMRHFLINEDITYPIPILFPLISLSFIRLKKLKAELLVQWKKSNDHLFENLL